MNVRKIVSVANILSACHSPGSGLNHLVILRSLCDNEGLPDNLKDL